jgi:hypothetical protein
LTKHMEEKRLKRLALKGQEHGTTHQWNAAELFGPKSQEHGKATQGKVFDMLGLICIRKQTPHLLCSWFLFA